jgi:hypothetical protein
MDQVPLDTWAAGKDTCAQFTEDALASAVLVRVRVTPLFVAVNVHVPDVFVVPETSPPAWSVRLPVSHPAYVTTAVAGKSDGSSSGSVVWPEPGNAEGLSSASSELLGDGVDEGADVAVADAVGVGAADRVGDAVGSSSLVAEQPAARRLRTPTTANAAIGRDAKCMLTGRPVDVDKGPGCVNGNPKVKVEGSIRAHSPPHGGGRQVSPGPQRAPASWVMR